MLSFLVRFFIVLISFILSAALSATVFYSLKQHNAGVDPLTIDPQVFLYAVATYLLDGIQMVRDHGVHIILGPIFLAIVIGFVLRIRTMFYYIPAGGLALLAIPILISYTQTTMFEQPDEASTFLYLVSGSAAGFFYWLVGGANAVPKRGVSFF